VSGRIEAVSAVVELIEKGGLTDKMTPSKKGQQLSRQTRVHSTDLCVMDSLTVHLGTSVQAFVGGHVDSTAEDLQIDQKEPALTSSQQSELFMAVIDRRDEVDFVGDVVTVLVLEIAVKEQMLKMLKARTMVVLMIDKDGKLHFSREIEAVSVNGKNGKDSMKMWNDQDSRTEEVAESLFVVVEVVDVDLVEVGVVLIDLEKETTSDILKGMCGSVLTSYIKYTYLICI